MVLLHQLLQPLLAKLLCNALGMLGNSLILSLLMISIGSDGYQTSMLVFQKVFLDPLLKVAFIRLKLEFQFRKRLCRLNGARGGKVVIPPAQGAIESPEAIGDAPWNLQLLEPRALDGCGDELGIEPFLHNAGERREDALFGSLLLVTGNALEPHQERHLPEVGTHSTLG
ncbi:hypothetical protein SDC9_91219 [bioreactor metagenome]|uniref:Uncharacterized protein n=1 Tax=bioreactor metagenome TaxID=1076179 RepID=A0A644ZX78_9ZZZZ